MNGKRYTSDKRYLQERLNAAYGELPRSQNRIIKTGQVTSYSAYDDGAFQIGLSEPASRFEDVNIAGVDLVIDHHTGLMWGKSKTSPVNNYGGILVWGSALSWAAGSIVAGFDDWRVANFMECITIFNFENSLIYPNFTGFAAADKMWTCSTWAPDTSKAVQLYNSSLGAALSFKTGSFIPMVVRSI